MHFCKVRVICLTDHNQARAVGKVVMICAHGVLHGVLCGCGGELHGHARKHAAVRDVLARFKIVPVAHGAGQVLCNVFDCRQRKRFAQDVSGP